MAIAAARDFSEDDDLAPVFNNLCSAAAIGLRSPEGTAFEPAAGILNGAEEGGAEAFANFLDLAPLSRDAVKKLPEWVARMTDERAAAARLAYSDATAIAPDAGPRFLEILAGQLSEPWQILRLIAAIERRPTDRFLAGSELSGIGERLLDDIDVRIATLEKFDPEGGVAAGTTAAKAAGIAYAQITEFEDNLDIKRDGPWGARLFKQKAQLTRLVEQRLKKVDDAAAAALPLKASRTGRKSRGMPDLSREPDTDAVTRAEAMVAFLERTRGAAQAGGYATLRTKVIEALDDRLDHYVDDVLDNLRGAEPEEPGNAAKCLDVAARLIGLFRDEKAAQIVRRRAAA